MSRNAWVDLVNVLLGRELSDPDDIEGEDPAIRRLGKVLRDPHASVLDKAAMIRHCLRAAAIRYPSQFNGFRCLRTAGWPDVETYRRVGITAHVDGEHFQIHAEPFRPVWVHDQGLIDTAAAAEQRRFHEREVRDPFLHLLFPAAGPNLSNSALPSYLNAGQKACVRAALLTPPGGTLVIELPTGDGKSLVFQAVANVGFGDADRTKRGVTLVIVPTVALALDQERAAGEHGFEIRPRAYRAGDDTRNRQLLQGIETGTQDLCFASPEAATGPMRQALMNVAALGRLQAIVIDEAHLVSGWGVEFRPEFQLFAGLRRELLRVAPTPARTLLLSATLTPSAVSVLRSLFAQDEDGHETPFDIVAAPRLRPELDYWIAETTDEETRRERVVEAVGNLPRPMIVYTTKVSDAEALYKRLCAEGYRRIALMTGPTRTVDREAVIEKWSNERIDVVVATAAFGLGIDYRHARTVIHACIPESLDRYYQEVGRAGRDGGAAVALALPAWGDFRVAQGMSQPTQIGAERGFQRWQAMTNQARHEGGYLWLPVDVRPGAIGRDIDMQSEQNTSWNERTLNLMAVAGAIALGPAGRTANGKPEQAVRVLDQMVHSPAGWETRTAHVREELRAAAAANLSGMMNVLKGSCAARSIAELYAIPEWGIGLDPTCSGCRACDHSPDRRQQQVTPIRPGRWDPEPLSAGASELCHRGLGFIWRDGDDWSKGDQLDVAELMRALAARGLRTVVVTPDVAWPSAWDQALRTWPVYVDLDRPNWLNPNGATLVIAEQRSILRNDMFSEQPAGQERLFLLPADFPDPHRPELPLRNRVGGKHHTIRGALATVQQ